MLDTYFFKKIGNQISDKKLRKSGSHQIWDCSSILKMTGSNLKEKLKNRKPTKTSFLPSKKCNNNED